MGRKVDGLKTALKNITGKEASGETIGEVFEDFNLHYVDVVTTLAVKDEDGEAITGATIVVKKGSTVGSGDAVTAETDGTYKVKAGDYNYSVSKTSYTTKTGTFTVDTTDAKAESKTVDVTLVAAE